MRKRCIQARFDGLIVRKVQHYNRNIGMGPGLEILFLPYRGDDAMPPISQATSNALADAG